MASWFGTDTKLGWFLAKGAVRSRVNGRDACLVALYFSFQIPDRGSSAKEIRSNLVGVLYRSTSAVFLISAPSIPPKPEDLHGYKKKGKLNEELGHKNNNNI